MGNFYNKIQKLNLNELLAAKSYIENILKDYDKMVEITTLDRRNTPQDYYRAVENSNFHPYRDKLIIINSQIKNLMKD